MPNSLCTYGYVSTSRLAPDKAADEIRRIVAHSAGENGRREITGALVYAEGRFAQIVEGSHDQIEQLKTRLAVDPRHEQLVPFSLADTNGRRFERWALAYSGHAPFFAAILRRLQENKGSPGEADRLAQLMQEFVVGDFFLVDDFAP